MVARSAGDRRLHLSRRRRRSGATSEKAGLIAPGDIGYFDKDGFLYLCDRAKDMIISGGVNIYPAEIEAELMQDAGRRRLRRVRHSGRGVRRGGLRRRAAGAGRRADRRPRSKTFLRGQMAGYKVPKRVDFHAELPREDSGKIFKRKLREPFWAGLDRRI